MKHFLLFTFLFAFYCFTCAAQQDTTYLYMNKGWQPCEKDSAFYYGIIYKKDGLYARKDFWVKGNQLQMEGTYLDDSCKKAQGTIKWYNENGTLKSMGNYDAGHAKTVEYYYESGKRRGLITYVNGKDIQQGWDEAGNEIPGYVVEREAKFPGGPQGWRAYLEQHLNANVAARSKAPVGIYTVKVQFIVDKEGNISKVQAISVPALCLRCGTEAVRVIKNGPKWEPAIQNGRNVIYQAIQYISFQVSEE